MTQRAHNILTLLALAGILAVLAFKKPADSTNTYILRIETQPKAVSVIPVPPQ